MNTRMIGFLLGRILMVEAGLLALPLLTALLYGEPLMPWLATMLVLAAIGGALSLRKPERTALYAKDGFAAVALVWLLSVKLLEPMYNRRVLADLNHAADVYSAIIEKYGKFESFDKSGGVHIPSDMMEEIMDNRGLLAGKCFEVAGTDCKVLLHLHQLQSDQCLLHPNPLSQLMEYSEPQWNSTAAVNSTNVLFIKLLSFINIKVRWLLGYCRDGSDR